MSSASRVLRATQAAAGYPPSSATWRVLATLDKRGAMRTSEIAVVERSSQATVSKLIGRLQREDLVEQHRDPNDGRAQLVSLTPAGRADLTKRRHQLASVLSSCEISPADAEVLIRAIGIVNDLTEQIEGTYER